MSRHVAALEQGELQGAIGAIRSIAMIVGPPFFTLLFAASAPATRRRSSACRGSAGRCCSPSPSHSRSARYQAAKRRFVRNSSISKNDCLAKGRPLNEWFPVILDDVLIFKH